MSRSKAIQIWFVAAMLVAAASVAVGASASVGTVAVLLVLCLVPPVIILMLWPRDLTTTAGDVIRGTDRPGER